MDIHHLHHVAFPCRDAKHTVLWYQQMLKMEFLYALPARAVPHADIPDPGIQVFLGAGRGTVLTFIEVAGRTGPEPAAHGLPWTQHISVQMADRPAWLALREHLVGQGVKLLGETDQGLFQGLHFADLDGHVVELTCYDPHATEQLRQLGEARWEMLETWSQTRKMPVHPVLQHPSAFAETVEMELKP